MKKITVEGVEFETPDEANWVASDDDGLTYWYAEEPEKNAKWGCWESYGSDSDYGYLGAALVTGWENSLRKI